MPASLPCGSDDRCLAFPDVLLGHAAQIVEAGDPALHLHCSTPRDLSRDVARQCPGGTLGGPSCNPLDGFGFGFRGRTITASAQAVADAVEACSKTRESTAARIA